MDDFSLASPAGHLIMGDGSGPDDLATKDGAKALSGAASVDTATTQVDKPSRTKNLITEYQISEGQIPVAAQDRLCGAPVTGSLYSRRPQ